MKKIFAMLLMSILVASTATAQVKNVKKAYKLAEAYENPDFYAAEEQIESALVDPSTSNDPYTWWVAGHIQDCKIAWENQKPFLGQNTDRDVQFEAAYRAYDYFVKCAELEKLPNAKGKVSDKLTKKLSATLAWYYKNFFIFNHGLKYAEYEDYNTTIKAFQKHLSIADLPFMKDYKGDSDAPKPEKDTTYYKIKYYLGIYTQLSGDNEGAIAIFEDIKNSGHKESEIYQYLFNLYKEKNDSANMLRVLNEGIDRFPKEVVFLGLTINIFLEQNKQADALRLLNKAIERNPDNAEYYTIRGQVNRSLGNGEAALKDYDKAIEMNPNMSIFYINKGEFLVSQATSLESMASGTSNKADANRLKGQARQYLEDAKQTMNRALVIDRNDVAALRLLRQIANKEDNQAEVERLAKRIKELE